MIPALAMLGVLGLAFALRSGLRWAMGRYEESRRAAYFERLHNAVPKRTGGPPRYPDVKNMRKPEYSPQQSPRGGQGFTGPETSGKD